MALYESNYLRLVHLIPELERLDGCFRSRVAGDCELHVDILERCRYTVTLSLTYLFETDKGRVADPDITVRAYLDGQLAEAMSLSGHHRHATLRRFAREHKAELDARVSEECPQSGWGGNDQADCEAGIRQSSQAELDELNAKQEDLKNQLAAVDPEKCKVY